MNYGEDVAYWYLRLNGFFPLANFVLHPTKRGDRQGDVDILAVRPPYVSESIGGQPDDWDRELLADVGPDAWIGVICEVKTGRPNRTELFRRDTVRAAVRRLGLLRSENLVNQAVKSLMRTPRYSTEAVVLVKLLVSTTPWNRDHLKEMNLEHLEEFVERRAARYADVKQRDRIYFPAGIFPYAIRRAVRDQASQSDAL